MQNITIKILIQGYAHKTNNGFIASSTCCLVETPKAKIITDPGCNRKALYNALQQYNLKTSDIDYVFLSHSHIDHILLAGVFDKAEFITYDYNLRYKDDRMQVFDKFMFGSGLEIIETPGHTFEDLSLLVHTEQGIYVIAGDVFWWYNDEIQVVDVYKKDEGEINDNLINSRKLLLGKADYIIPGHGRVFQVNKTARDSDII